MSLGRKLTFFPVAEQADRAALIKVIWTPPLILGGFPWDLEFIFKLSIFKATSFDTDPVSVALKSANSEL